MLRNSTALARLMLCASVAALAADLSVVPAVAQSTSPGEATETAVGKLLQKMVNKKVLTRSEAQEMIDGLHADLQKAAAAPQAQPSAPEAGTVRVPYVSPTVKQEIVNQVKSEVMTKAEDEHWAAPGAMPEWTKRLHIFGDIRVRDEGRFFNKNNNADFIDTYAVNNGSAVDIHATNAALPVLNSTQDRNFVRLRARLGVGVDISESWTAAIRLATGSDNSPVSTNQTLANDFGKKAVWLDQAYIKYEPLSGDAVIVGRMPNPFVHTDLVWDDDINPDGAAFTGAYSFPGLGLSLHGTAAAFTLDGASDNANANAVSNNKVGMSTNRWMFGGQLGASYDMTPLKLGLDAAYYDYANVQSKLSSACSNVTAPVLGCDTDATRPSFMQKGNTLFLLRRLVDVANNGADPQYFGLASKFGVLDLIASADYVVSDKMHINLTGDYAKNLDYGAGAIKALPIANNNETCSVAVPSGETCAQAGGVSIFKSGDTAWLVKLTVGNPKVDHFGDWNVGFTYANIQPDALLDAFTDSDFHLGGTNAKGWTFAGNLGLTKGTWLTAKWSSTGAVSGPRFDVDVLQIDLTTRF